MFLSNWRKARPGRDSRRNIDSNLPDGGYGTTSIKQSIKSPVGETAMDEIRLIGTADILAEKVEVESLKERSGRRDQ